MDDPKSRQRATLQFLASLQQSGITDLPMTQSSQASPAPNQPPVAADASAEPGLVMESPGPIAVPTDMARSTAKRPAAMSLFEAESAAAGGDDYGPALGLEQRRSQLQLLAEQVASCTLCDELAQHRTQTVFGVGNPQPRLCFLGEGPGADEDKKGEPFVGRAGQLLTKIIEACQMRRDDVYILNTVKCRPPGNRNPSDQELTNCWPHAVKQLEILQPEFICCLGSVAARTLLQTKESIGRLRQRFFSYRSSQVIVTYHPAYLLRNPSAKSLTWDDMKMLMQAMGIEYSGPGASRA